MAKVRALWGTPEFVYIVHGAYLYKMDTSNNITYLGALDSTDTPVKIRSNGNQLMLVDGTDGYIFKFSDRKSVV